MSREGWLDDILAFWLDEVGEKGWWTRSDATDAAIARRFGPLWEAEHGKPAENFIGTPDTALAAVILFDQFSRNLFRHTAKAFSADTLALAIAKRAIAMGFDESYATTVRQFFYLPFMHSENLADQDRSLELFEALGLADNLKFAREHHSIVARFGRFPHRNESLGRETLPSEKEAVAEGQDW